MYNKNKKVPFARNFEIYEIFYRDILKFFANLFQFINET